MCGGGDVLVGAYRTLKMEAAQANQREMRGKSTETKLNPLLYLVHTSSSL